MKSFTSKLIATLIVTASTSVSAASSTDLTVKGLITPNACDLTISKGGIFDLGKISVNDLNEDLPTSVGRADFQLDVTCDEKSLIALNVVDNQSGTSTTSRALGLGLINGNQKIGYASMQFIPSMPIPPPLQRSYPRTLEQLGGQYHPTHIWLRMNMSLPHHWVARIYLLRSRN